MQGTQRDADLAAWWGWVPKVLGTVFPSGGAGGKSLRDEVWCCTPGSLRPAALQRGSCDSRPGPETPQAHAPVRAEGGPRPSRAHSRVRRGGRRGQAVPGHSACVVPTVPRANGLSSPKSPGPRVGSPGGASPGPTSGPLHWGGRARRPGGGGRTAAPAGPPLSTTLTGGWGGTTPAEHALWGAAPGTRGEVTVTESPARR